MASDYAAIKEDNIRRYGTDIGRFGPMLLTDRYDERTHFLFELLQNAEDALSRREGWEGSRAVRFQLDDQALRISHCGQPFDEIDVRGVCGIAESSKRLTEIGRFGIGFKSVYAFTDRPEVHSGNENFAVENFVWPLAVAPIDRPAEETVIVLPLKDGADDRAEIEAGLQNLNARSLLFLRHIEEVAWQVGNERSGLCRRGQTDYLGEGVRQVAISGQLEQDREGEEEWLIFSQQVTDDCGAALGWAEIAFLLEPRSGLVFLLL